jgi:hypothetical protein
LRVIGVPPLVAKSLETTLRSAQYDYRCFLHYT